MESYDVVIVGAGPSGSTAAYYIDNLKVLIIDKFDFPRYKSCGGGLMSGKDWSLELENFKKIEKKIKSAHDCRSLKIYWNNIFVASRTYKHLFTQVDRFEFDNLLLNEALNKENVSFLKFELKEIKKENDLISLSDGEKKIFCSYLIGADGVHSKVAKFLKNKNLKIREVGHCTEIDLKCNKISNDVHVSPGYGWEIGYSWNFPTATG